MSDFRNEIRTAILGWLKENRHVNVTEAGGKYNIRLRSLQGPPFELFGKIKIGEVEVTCLAETRRDDPRRRGTLQELYRVDLADPQMFDILEQFVNEIKN
jgi:hypothetical protein